MQNYAPMPYNGSDIYSARIGLPVEPEKAELLSPRFGTAHLYASPPVPQDRLPFTQHVQLHTDDSLSFGGYSGHNFLIRNPK